MVKEMAPGVWNLTPERSGSYLIAGSERALLLDTGFGTEDVLALARGCTDLPILLANTQYHHDHTGCNHLFAESYAHPLEHERLRDTGPRLIPVEEGFIFDLGGRRLEVLHLPGHTPGSIALLDRANRMVFTGDLIAAGHAVHLQKDDCDLDAYVVSLKRIEAMADDLDYIFPCHGEGPVDIVWAGKLQACVDAYRRGETEGEPFTYGPPDHPQTTNCHRYGGAAILRND